MASWLLLEERERVAGMTIGEREHCNIRKITDDGSASADELWTIWLNIDTKGRLHSREENIVKQNQRAYFLKNKINCF